MPELLESQVLRDVAHVAHAEILTPKLTDSVRFFVDILGMEPVTSEGNSVYLRGSWDYESYCLKVTGSQAPGLGHVGLRAATPAALNRRAQALEASGCGIGWIEGDFGHGPAYQFLDADGHRFEIYYETTRYVAPEHLRPVMKNQPQRTTGRGVGVKRLDHVNLLAQDVRACRLGMEQNLGFLTREVIRLDDGREAGAWTSLTVMAHELIYVLEELPTSARLHHLAFWVDAREDVLRAADLMQDAGIFIEAGPSRHTAIQAFFLYVYEPGGNRIEVTTGGYLVYDPDAPLILWGESEWANRPGWGARLPASFNTYGTPMP
jgi:catechol 2,3-dioxygenase